MRVVRRVRAQRGLQMRVVRRVQARPGRQVRRPGVRLGQHVRVQQVLRPRARRRQEIPGVQCAPPAPAGGRRVAALQYPGCWHGGAPKQYSTKRPSLIFRLRS